MIKVYKDCCGNDLETWQAFERVRFYGRRQLKVAPWSASAIAKSSVPHAKLQPPELYI